MEPTDQPPAGDKRQMWMHERSTLLAAMQDYPELPIPSLYTESATFYVFQVSPELERRAFAYAENALGASFGVSFTLQPNDEPERDYCYLLATLPSGWILRITAHASAVAEVCVTGQTVKDVIGLVRLPVADESPAPVTA
jgi:hypothetical protein